MRYYLPLLKRFLAKLFLDILPAGMASVVGGFLVTHHQDIARVVLHWPSAEHAAPASVEMMRVVRDEHALMADFLKQRMAAEKARLDAEDSASTRAAGEITPVRPAADVAPLAAPPALRRAAVTMAAAKPVALRQPSVEITPLPGAPLEIVQTQPNEGAASVARRPDSILAATVSVKDHVVAATQRVVSAIGSIPMWILSAGERIGGMNNSSSSSSQYVSANW